MKDKFWKLIRLESKVNDKRKGKRRDGEERKIRIRMEDRFWKN